MTGTSILIVPPGSVDPSPRRIIGQTEKGHIRHWTRRLPGVDIPTYGKYAHRIVMAGLCKIFSPWTPERFNPKTGLPKDINGMDMVVHHVDARGYHNCPPNLQLLDKTIHDFITHDHRRFVENERQRLRPLSLFAEEEYALEEAEAIRKEAGVSNEQIVDALSDMTAAMYEPGPPSSFKSTTSPPLPGF